MRPIDADRALEIVRDQRIAHPNAYHLTNYATLILREAPTIDVAPVRHGCWERVIPSKSAAKWSTKVSCSNCHSAGYAHHKYCPNCGAKMDGGVEDARL